MNFFRPTEKAIFLKRPNRFVVLGDLNGRTIKAFLPNPGRLWELLLPRAVLYLEKSSNPDRRMSYTVVAVEREGRPVMVHTHRVNDLAEHLLRSRLIPGLDGAQVLKREITYGGSRFDFLLRRGGEEIFLEVKSCTLFGRHVAMFPDAVTARGRKHIEELIELSASGKSGAVLFLIGWPRAKFFMPEFHTDLEFSRTLLEAKEKIAILPVAVEWEKDLSLNSGVRILEIPWELVDREAEDRGGYILILKLPTQRSLKIGKLGKVPFKAGYYLYVGSARKNLTQRIERHRRLGKKFFWHVDYLRNVSEFQMALPIRTADVVECEIARAMRSIADWEVSGFGSSDCSCSSHLFGMDRDPIHTPDFISLLQYFRMDRLFCSRGNSRRVESST